MAAEATLSIEQAERVDHQLVRGIGIPALTANMVSSIIGAGSFVIPATVARGLGPAAPLAGRHHLFRPGEARNGCPPLCRQPCRRR